MILKRNYAFDIMPGGLPLLIRASKKDTSSRLIFSLFAGRLILQRFSGEKGSTLPRPLLL